MDPMYYRQGDQGQQVPVYNNATPGFGGAISDMVRALAMALAPRSITQRRQNIDSQTAAQQGLGYELTNK